MDARAAHQWPLWRIAGLRVESSGRSAELDLMTETPRLALCVSHRAHQRGSEDSHSDWGPLEFQEQMMRRKTQQRDRGLGE